MTMRPAAMNVAAFFVVLAVTLGGCSGSRQASSDAAPSASPAPLESTAGTASPEASASPQESSSAEASASPLAAGVTPAPASSDTGTANPAASPSPSDTPSPSPKPTIPAQPTGLPVSWQQQSERVVNGPEADLVVRTGDINNLGYGWPAHFTPFSGKSTPAHAYPCGHGRPGSAPGTDVIMIGSSVTDKDILKPHDGYSGPDCATRPYDLPAPISLDVGALPATIHGIYLQAFLDDFQAPVWKSHFQVTLDGTRIPNFETTINALNQTGPIGKLVTLRLLPEYWPLVKSNVDVLFDDPTTGNPDGYAVDFVRLLVNPKPWRYAVIVHCTITDADTGKPIDGATCSAVQDSVTTTSDGKATLRGLPAGIVSTDASAVGYDSATQLLDLPAGNVGEAAFALKKHKETIGELRALMLKTCVVPIYGIHFDTASAKLRPDSTSSLVTIRELIGAGGSSHWIIAGHTDNQGGAEYNLGLSNDRAKSVVAWLEQHGVANSRLEAKGYGLTRPVADNGSDAGRALNRRVEVQCGKR